MYKRSEKRKDIIRSSLGRSSFVHAPKLSSVSAHCFLELWLETGFSHLRMPSRLILGLISITISNLGAVVPSNSMLFAKIFRFFLKIGGSGAIA